MKKLHMSYLPAIFLRVTGKRSFVPRLAAFLRAAAYRSCNECFTESPCRLMSTVFITHPFTRLLTHLSGAY